MIDTSLLIGLALIGAGLGLGAFAFFIVTRSREEKPETGAPSDQAPPEPGKTQTEPASPQPPVATPPPEPPAAAPSPPLAPSPPEPPAAAPSPGRASSLPLPTTEPAPPPSTGDVDMPETPSAPSPAPNADERLFPVVTLMRDDTTGELALRVGRNTYRTVAELRDSPDRTRVEFAARDLALWLEGRTAVPQPKKEERPSEANAGRGTMVEQINRILEHKLSGRPLVDRAIRLVEGAGGSVRVYLGVQGYSLDEVPDPAIRSLIREAVAEWEASQ